MAKREKFQLNQSMKNALNAIANFNKNAVVPVAEVVEQSTADEAHDLITSENQTTGEIISEEQLAKEAADKARRKMGSRSGSTFKKYAQLFGLPVDDDPAFKPSKTSFVVWCSRGNRCPRPARPETVADFVEYLDSQDKKKSTIELYLASIAYAHKAVGLPSPTTSEVVKEALDAAERERATAAENRKRPSMQKEGAESLSVENLCTIVDGIDGDSLTDLRDKALLLVTFHTALRRSEVAAIRMNHITFTDDHGVPMAVITIPKSKTDQLGKGQRVHLWASTGKKAAAHCPIRALERWIQAAGLKDTDPLFCSVGRWGNLMKDDEGRAKPIQGQDVNRILQRRAKAVGLVGKDDKPIFSAHSMRHGFVNAALDAGATALNIQHQTRHTSSRMIDYYAAADNERKHNAAKLLNF